MLVNRADSHTSGARFVGQPADLPERWQKKDDTANLTEFYLWLCFLPKPKRDNEPKRLLWKMDFANQSHKWTRTQILKNLTLSKNDKAKETEIILQTQLTRTFATKRQANFESLPNQPRRKPKPRNKANQNQSWPKRKPKTLKPILATR